MSGLGWLRPAWLLALLLVPLAAALIAWSLGHRRRALDAFADPHVRSRTQPLPVQGRIARGGLLLVGLTGLVLAAAGPQWGREQVATPPVGQEIVFALDVSRSMLAEDVAPSRIERAKLAIRQILAVLPTAEAGLVAFAGDAALVVPLTPDHAALELYLDAVGPDWISDPSTDLGQAVGVALEAFGPARAPGRAIVVFSDGEEQVGSLAGAARTARDRGVEVEGVGVGTAAGARIPTGLGGWLESGDEVVVTRLETETLEAAAAATEGVAVTLGSGDPGLPAVVARLQSLETGREARAATERRADRYRWPLVLAVLALGLEIALRARAAGDRDRRVTGGRGGRSRSATAAVALLLLAMGRTPSPGELYDEGRYREALLAWRQADRGATADPADAYNRGNAAYRLGEHREAAASYAVAARTAAGAARRAAAWYNAGNARYRLAEEVERARGEAASVRFWDAAVGAYREALLRTPGDRDAKHNLELALRRRRQAGGGGGGGGGEQGGGSPAGGEQPSAAASDAASGAMNRSEAERLLDALAAQEREALTPGPGDRRGAPPQARGW